jgi:hypothetical protein
MMLAFALSLLVSLAIGFLTVSLVWPVGRFFKTHLLLRICLAVGVGHGVTSCLLFLWLLVHGRADRTYIAVETVALALLLAGLYLREKRRGAALPAEAPSDVRTGLRYGWLFPAAFCAAGLATAVAVALAVLREPHGNGWDAWAIYGLRARAIFRGGGQWAEGFSGLIAWSHPDYPLLLPLSTARIWLYCGHELAFAQAVLTALFTLATVGLLCSALAALRSRAQGFLAGVVLLGYTMFVAYGGSAYADVPVMFYFAATFVLFAFYQESGAGKRNYLILAGASAGLAAWTKNEGLLFVACAVAAHALVALRAHGWKRCLQQLLFIALGLVPLLAILFYFKTRLAPPSELMAAMGSESASGKLLDYHRYVYIAREFWRQIIYYCGRGVNLAYLLAIYLVCVGATLRRKRIVLQLGLTLCLMLAGCFIVYLTTPHDLVFHVKFSMDRLMMQQWPGFIFLYFLVARSPEEALGREGEDQSQPLRVSTESV